MSDARAAYPGAGEVEQPSVAAQGQLYSPTWASAQDGAASGLPQQQPGQAAAPAGQPFQQQAAPAAPAATFRLKVTAAAPAQQEPAAAPPGLQQQQQAVAPAPADGEAGGLFFRLTSLLQGGCCVLLRGCTAAAASH